MCFGVLYRVVLAVGFGFLNILPAFAMTSNERIQRIAKNRPVPLIHCNILVGEQWRADLRSYPSAQSVEKHA